MLGVGGRATYLQSLSFLLLKLGLEQERVVLYGPANPEFVKPGDEPIGEGMVQSQGATENDGLELGPELTEVLILLVGEEVHQDVATCKDEFETKGIRG